MATSEKSKKKLFSVEFLRFLFSLLIVYFHILHSNILPLAKNIPAYAALSKACGNTGYIVECFFIISGYFLVSSIRNEKIGFFHFTLKKIFRLWPVLAFSALCSFAFMSFNAKNVLTQFLNLLFLQNSGLSLYHTGINWYISPLFWIMLFYYGVIKFSGGGKQYFLVAILVYFGYLANISVCKGGFDRSTALSIVNLGMCRALGGIGLGILLHRLSEELPKVKSPLTEKKRMILLSVAEVSSFIFLLAYFLGKVQYNNRFVIVPVFSILFLSFIHQGGIMSRILDWPGFSILGRYAYSIYVMQQVCFWILQRTLWKTAVIQNIPVCIGISLVFSIVVGVGTYHLVEKPGNKVFRNIKFYDKQVD